MGPAATRALGVADAPAGARCEPWSGHAFGVNLRADFAVAGLAPCQPLKAAGEHTSLQLDSEEAIASQWKGRSLNRLTHWGGESDEPDGLDSSPELGYRFAVSRWGTFTLTPDGRHVRCAPAAGSDTWGECLRGQVLPMVAVLRGLEVFHASAVTIGGCTAGFVGVSTAGKTSLAVNLVARGARLVTDDVLSLKISEQGLLSFPGTGLVNLRDAEAASMGEGWRQLGTVIARGPDFSKILVERIDRPSLLTALYFLERSPHAETRIERMERSDPGLLLASSFNFVVRERARLVNQLDVCAALSAQVPQFRLSIGTDSVAGAVSEEVLEHMDGLGKTSIR